jgi:hypothetical protein
MKQRGSKNDKNINEQQAKVNGGFGLGIKLMKD